MVRTIDMIASASPPLDYDRYLRLQQRLRRARRELFLICQHPPTITAGVQSRPQNLHLTDAELRRRGVKYAQIARGGDHTAHEPGQWIFYAHLDLRRRQLGFSEYFRMLLESVQQAVQHTWSLETFLDSDRPGLYSIDGRKLLSIGLDLKSFFSSHGLALNVKNSLSSFSAIAVCGHAELRPVSIEQLGGASDRIGDFTQRFLHCLAEALEFSTRDDQPSTITQAFTKN